jgi:hypothetical protein
MGLRRSRLDSVLAKVETTLRDMPSQAAERVVIDAAALRFHLSADSGRPPLAAVLGGTGTGKSTLVNRLVGQDLTATSLLRTYTAGPVAIAASAEAIPSGWLRFAVVLADPPARGQPGSLLLATAPNPLTEKVSVVDTPDLDGDQPLHHAQADRVFRWSEALVFVVTPEKYQMTELLPYYRLAKRYGLPAWFVMNKCEESNVLEDFKKQLANREWADAQVYVLPRDDAAYQPPQGAGLADLREALCTVERRPHEQGLIHRSADLAERLMDQVVVPGRGQRHTADRMIQSLRALERPAAGVDVNPVTLGLQRRLQQRSVLYLMGPQRLLDRVRQMPILVARLPRTVWDVIRGEPPQIPDPTAAKADGSEVPDFGGVLEDQFRILQTRIEDLLRSTPEGERWLQSDNGNSNEPFESSKIDVKSARQIAEEELANLKAWLEKRWERDPRDTRVLMTLLKHLPGGEKLTRWSEAAPYLLAIIVATHGAFFGHIDLLILGGYSLATWLTERLSNEVSARTRATNRKIEQRFAQLAHEQITRTCAWIDRQAPSLNSLKALEDLATELHAPATA